MCSKKFETSTEEAVRLFTKKLNLAIPKTERKVPETFGTKAYDYAPINKVW